MLASPPAPAEEIQGGPASTAARGSLLFRIHCQNCHGRSGTGNGPMAKLMTVPPANLTMLAVRDGGEFPTERVRRVIDGRAEVRAHGMREMPVWGLTLAQRDRDNDQEAETRARIEDLVAHLKSIQAKE